MKTNIREIIIDGSKDEDWGVTDDGIIDMDDDDGDRPEYSTNSDVDVDMDGDEEDQNSHLDSLEDSLNDDTGEYTDCWPITPTVTPIPYTMQPLSICTLSHHYSTRHSTLSFNTTSFNTSSTTLSIFI